MPKVSVILPTYKRPEFLHRAMMGVINQNYEDWELVVVNDGDKDIEELILKFSKKEPRINYVFLHKNSGCVSIPRNIGILYSKGEYICPLDDDIIIEGTRLSNSVRALDNNPEAVLVYGTQVRHTPNTGNYEISNIPDYNPLNGCGVDNSQIMYRRKVYDKITMKFPRRACDWELMKDIWTAYPHSFVNIPEIVSTYVWHGGNRSLDNSTKTKDIHPEDYQDGMWWHLVKRHYNIDWAAK